MTVLTHIGKGVYICNICTPTQELINELTEELGNLGEGDIRLLDPPAWVAAIVAMSKCQMPNNYVYVIVDDMEIDLSTSTVKACRQAFFYHYSDYSD